MRIRNTKVWISRLVGMPTDWTAIIEKKTGIIHALFPSSDNAHDYLFSTHVGPDNYDDYETIEIRICNPELSP